ncbi:DUF6348 family protein [Mucilaginibacter dorajii]|uniref:Uncharacterized protein n=1 Tax=Mucilaginibacter dorajii TaxID=692994 RepID=A0ABP7PMM6_9SPHI|nr:DUF6348 family protein [Mucilaginibacter dorajii]MCS3733575.1 hypothetical protein [Mucilaginibacter dorajii]
MGLFDFFKKKPITIEPPQQPADEEPIDRNLELLEAFKLRLIEMGYKVEWHNKYQGIVINDELEIATTIVNNPNNHPSVLQLIVLAIHLQYFPGGIQECFVGIGLTFQDQVKSALHNYIDSIFLTIIDSFSESHNPDFDFMVNTDGKDVLWHPKFGSMLLQGKWDEQPIGEPLFELLNKQIPDKLTSNKINWLKIYLFKRDNEPIIGDCLLNNQPWDEGMALVSQYANSWNVEGDFKGIKQFIMFRRCD